MAGNGADGGSSGTRVLFEFYMQLGDTKRPGETLCLCLKEERPYQNVDVFLTKSACFIFVCPDLFSHLTD